MTNVGACNNLHDQFIKSTVVSMLSHIGVIYVDLCNTIFSLTRCQFVEQYTKQ